MKFFLGNGTKITELESMSKATKKDRRKYERKQKESEMELYS